MDPNTSIPSISSSQNFTSSSQHQIIRPKLKLLLISVVLVGGGIVGGIFLDRLSYSYLMSSNPRYDKSELKQSPLINTSDSKTYTDNINNYEFSFSYPAKWQVNSNRQFFELDKVGLYPIFTVSKISQASNHLAFSVPVGTKMEVGDKIYEEKIADTKLDGISAGKFKRDVIYGSGTDAIPALFVRTSNNFELFLYDANPENITYFDHIISTFDFTNAVPTIAPNPTVVPISDGSPYQKSDYDYSIIPPKSWEIFEAGTIRHNRPMWTGEILVQDELNKVTFLEKDSSGSFEITIKPAYGKNIDEWDQEFRVPLSHDPSSNLAEFVKDALVSGKPAKEFSIFDFDANKTLIATIYKDRLYEFSFTGQTSNDPDIDRHLQIYKTMLSSFKFLD